MPSGLTILDFGPFPGKSDAAVDIMWQNWINPTSRLQAWIEPSTTVDHSADEHLVETVKILAGNIVPGVGFTIYGLNSNPLSEAILSGGGGRGTRLYGKWTVAWQWQ